MSLSTSDLATALDTAPKTLRQFLRSREVGVGSGARYSFTDDQVDTLREEFNTWADARSSRKRRPAAAEIDAPGLPMGAPMDDVRAITEARVDRLEAMLRERGMHISQMKDHHTWRSPVSADA